LILTAIVIGFALTVVLAALSLRAYRAQGTLNTDELRSAEHLGNPVAGGADGDR
jgi:multicomponent Na+:H+ antiporter subunit C